MSGASRLVAGFSPRDEWVWTGTGWEWAGYGEPTTERPPYAPTEETTDGYTDSGSAYSPPTPPEASPSAGRKKALNKYLNHVQWKRRELGRLIAKYRTEFPKQIRAYSESAYGALPKAEKSMWGNMYANLDQRGLADSSSFRGGAKVDLENWLASEKSAIEDTKHGMEAGAQQSILQALGQPNYGALYQNWVVADDQMAAKEFRDFEKKTRKK